MRPFLKITALGLALFAAPCFAQAAEPREALFDLVLDMNGDGKPDRAVLVGGPGSDHAVFDDGGSKRLMLSASPDLYVYLGGGNEKLDLSRAPDIVKKEVADPQSNYIYALETNGKGSLRVKSSYNLYGEYTQETITLAFRDGAARVIGYTFDYERKSGAQGGCDLNFLSGRGVYTRGVQGQPKALAQKFSPVALADWSTARRSRICVGG